MKLCMYVPCMCVFCTYACLLVCGCMLFMFVLCMGILCMYACACVWVHGEKRPLHSPPYWWRIFQVKWKVPLQPVWLPSMLQSFPVSSDYTLDWRETIIPTQHWGNPGNSTSSHHTWLTDLCTESPPSPIPWGIFPESILAVQEG